MDFSRRDLEHYLRWGWVSWSEDFSLPKPPCEFCGPGTFLTQDFLYDGTFGHIDWVCWTCGGITHDPRDRYRTRSREEIDAITAKIKAFVAKLTPADELELRRWVARPLRERIKTTPDVLTRV